MRFRVLGPLEIETDDGPIAITGQRPRALLTALLLQPRKLVSTDRLVDALWDEDRPDSPANALQQVVTRLRARLGRWARVVRTEPGGYLLAAPEGSIDAEEFELSYRRARTLMDADPGQAARVLDRALALWRGPAYGEFGNGFAHVSAVRLDELRMAALEDRVELLLRGRCGHRGGGPGAGPRRCRAASGAPDRPAHACSARRRAGRGRARRLPGPPQGDGRGARPRSVGGLARAGSPHPLR